MFSVGNAGFYGYASDLDVFVLDGLGLTDTVNSHMEAGPPGRPGHEKVYPAWWLLARYGSPDLAERQVEGLPDVDLVAASRAALSCGDLAELVEATTAPMTLGPVHRQPARRARPHVAAHPGRPVRGRARVLLTPQIRRWSVGALRGPKRGARATPLTSSSRTTRCR